mgnify:CR=1 FL=1
MRAVKRPPNNPMSSQVLGACVLLNNRKYGRRRENDKPNQIDQHLRRRRKGSAKCADGSTISRLQSISRRHDPRLDQRKRKDQTERQVLDRNYGDSLPSRNAGGLYPTRLLLHAAGAGWYHRRLLGVGL